MGYKKVYLHRVIAEAKIGRALRSGEIVHHIDHNPLNNHPDNLEVCSSSFVHSQHHRRRKEKLDSLVEIDGLWF
jgi:CRISPR/Cas system-associated exonuclease Cas4 (RecB family)